MEHANMQLRVEPAAYNMLKTITVQCGADVTSYLRMRILSAIRSDSVNVYSNPANKFDEEKKTSRISLSFPREIRDAFKELCQRKETTMSYVICGWIYKTIDLNTIWFEE